MLVLSARKVCFTPVLEAQQLREVLAGLSLVLKCQVSPAEMPLSAD